jgi:hypothetical protein
MNGAIPPLPKNAFMAWYSVTKKARGQLYLLTLYHIGLDAHVFQIQINCFKISQATDTKLHTVVNYFPCMSLIFRHIYREMFKYQL